MTLRTRYCIPVLAALLLWTLHVRSQQVETPGLELTRVPSYGTFSDLHGTVSGVRPFDARVAVYIFIPDLGWYSKPNCSQMANIAVDGTWSADITTGPVDETATKIAAYLLPSGFVPECVQAAGGIPTAIDRIAMAKVSVSRLNPGVKSLRFSGLDWTVKASRTKVYPGPNFFADDPSNVWVDGLGRLHLRVARCGSEWCSAEIISRANLGYGLYRFILDTSVHDLDPNIVLGLFTWSENAEYNNREIDIEFSRWGNPASTFNAQYVVQPYTGRDNMKRFALAPSTSSIHSFQWERAAVSFHSSPGALGVPSPMQWSYTSLPGIPPVGDVQLHLNLYAANGRAPLNGVGNEIIISRFEYVPSGPFVSLASTATDLAFEASSGSLDVNATDPSCVWSATTDAHWLKLISSSGTGSGAIRYSAAENTGASRRGRIVLTSSNCTSNIAAQESTLTQSALVCSYTTTVPETFTDFREKAISLFVRSSSALCRWVARANASWITVRGGQSGAGSGPVECWIAANLSGIARRGTLLLGDYVHAVNQDGLDSTLVGFPNPIQACTGSGGRQGLVWATSVARRVDIRVGSPAGPAIGHFNASGSTITDEWVKDGTLFFLQSADSGNSSGSERTLASFRSSVQTGCPAASPVLFPNGIANAASYQGGPVTPGESVSLFGQNLALRATTAASNRLPTELDGISVLVNGLPAPLFFVSPGQINFLVPPETPLGRATISLVGTRELAGELVVASTAPGIYTASGNGRGVPAANVIRAAAGGAQSIEPVYRCGAGVCSGAPIRVTPDDQVVLVLFGTGVRFDNWQKQVRCTIGGTVAQVLFAGAQGIFAGLDQVNVLLPTSLSGAGEVDMVLEVDGKSANVVKLTFE